MSATTKDLKRENKGQYANCCLRGQFLIMINECTNSHFIKVMVFNLYATNFKGKGGKALKTN